MISGRWASKQKPVTALDLGGSSTQVTYALKSTNDASLNDYTFTVSTQSPPSQVNVFSTSYANLGAESVRQAVFSHGNAPGATELHTICMHQDTVPSKIGFGKTTYVVQ